MIRDELYQTGIDTRRAMFGAAGAEETTESTTGMNDKLQEVVTRLCFGEMWGREELSLRMRSIVTVSMLLASGKERELSIHMKGALANGVTEVELREICLHSIMYCGIPASNEGLRCLEAILKADYPDSPLLKPAQD